MREEKGSVCLAGYSKEGVDDLGGRLATKAIKELAAGNE